MAFSRIYQTGDGVWTDITLGFPYLDASHIIVTVDGVLSTDWYFATPDIIRFNTAPADGELVLAARSTSQATRLVDWESGSAIIEEDLDNDSLQAFYMAQEALDRANDQIAIDIASGAFDAQLIRLINLLDPVDPNDAATKEYVDNLIYPILNAYDDAVQALAVAEAALALAQSLIGQLNLGDFAVGFSVAGPLDNTDGLVLYRVHVPADVYIPANMVGSYGSSVVGPGAAQSFYLKRQDNTDIARVDLATDGTATFTALVGESTIIPAGERLSVALSASAGSVAEDLTLTFLLQRA